MGGKWILILSGITIIIFLAWILILFLVSFFRDSYKKYSNSQGKFFNQLKTAMENMDYELCEQILNSSEFEYLWFDVGDDVSANVGVDGGDIFGSNMHPELMAFYLDDGRRLSLSYSTYDPWQWYVCLTNGTKDEGLLAIILKTEKESAVAFSYSYIPYKNGKPNGEVLTMTRETPSDSTTYWVEKGMVVDGLKDGEWTTHVFFDNDRQSRIQILYDNGNYGLIKTGEHCEAKSYCIGVNYYYENGKWELSGGGMTVSSLDDLKREVPFSVNDYWPIWMN